MSGLVDRLASQRARAALRAHEARETDGPRVRLAAGEAASAPALASPTVEGLNRFPDPEPAALLARMADLYGAPTACIAIVNDVADARETLVRIFRRPGSDEGVVLATAGFPAAALAAELHGAKVYDASPGPGGAFDRERVGAAIFEAGETALVFLASPTHETGEVIPSTVIRELQAEIPDALFIVDESFIEIAGAPSLATHAAESENLVVLRSLSRGYGLAGIRCGAVIASARIVQLLRAALAFRPVPTPSVRLAVAALSPLQAPLHERRLAALIVERERVAKTLARAPAVIEVRPSKASFVSIKAREGMALARRLAERGIAVAWDDVASGELRLTIGAPAENDLALAAFGVSAPPGRHHRTAEIAPETNETRIAVRVDLDGHPRAKIATGIAFFDHMLEQLAKHGGFDLTLMCEGAIEVDAHYSIEDSMLALGTALKVALGDNRGIGRYGFAVPVDEAEAEALIDLSGRPYTLFEGEFQASHIGDYPTEMTAHAFRSLAETLGAAIHVKVRGENDHHKTEACYRALARALRQAIRVEGEHLPSA
jgi:histidinol-phosphate aminotransferase/imidazoleglycerol-phosphate dehydratase/histidinol-phosphatase